MNQRTVLEAVLSVSVFRWVSPNSTYVLRLIKMAVSRQPRNGGEEVPGNSCQTMENEEKLYFVISRFAGTTVQKATTARVLLSSPNYSKIHDLKLPPQLFKVQFVLA